MERKKMQELQNKIMGQRSSIGLTKGVTHDIRKRQFIRKGILGIIAGLGIAIFSKISRAATGGINFYGEPDGSIVDSSKGVAKAWGNITAVGVLSTPSYGISSVGDTGTGDRDVNFTTAFSDADFAPVAEEFSSGSFNRKAGFLSLTTGDVNHTIRDNNSALADSISAPIFFGDQ
jgi:hypothetical protein